MDFSREDLLDLLNIRCRINEKDLMVTRLLEQFSFEQLQLLLLFVGWIETYDGAVFGKKMAAIHLEPGIFVDGDEYFVYFSWDKKEIFTVNLDNFYRSCLDMTPCGLITLAAYLVRARVMFNFPTTEIFSVEKVETILTDKNKCAELFTIVDKEQRAAIARYSDFHEQDRLLIGRLAAETSCLVACSQKSGSRAKEPKKAPILNQELKRILTLDAAEFFIEGYF